MIKILINVFLAFIADILSFVFFKLSFDLRIFVIGFFFIFLFYIILDFIYYIYAKRSKSEVQDEKR